MRNFKRIRKANSWRMVPLAAVTWICFVFGYQSNSRSHIHRGRTAGFVKPVMLSPSSPRFAFPWFGESTTDKDEKDLGSTTESNISGNQAENLSDAANIIECLKSSQRIGERTSATLRELSYTVVEGLAADGNVRVTFNGQQIPVGVEVDETYLKEIISGNEKEGVDKLCLALTKAMQDAHYKSGVKVEEKMKSLYSDLEFESE